jgi:hypothetical protein
VLFGAKLKLREFGIAASGLVPLGELALSDTGIERKFVVELMLMNPTSVPDVGAPAPTETLSESGVGPLVGVTTSQLLLEKAVTVMLVAPLEDETRTVWGVGVTPDCVLNVNCDGFALSVLFCALAVSKEHTSATTKSPRIDGLFCVLFKTCSNKSKFGGVARTRLRPKLRAIPLPRPIRPALSEIGFVHHGYATTVFALVRASIKGWFRLPVCPSYPFAT